MDITLAMINLGHKQYDVLIEEIMQSNLPRSIQIELKDLLATALMQADQAREMGWLPKKSIYSR